MNNVPDAVRKEHAALATKPDFAIDLTDLPATSSKDWRGLARGQFYKPVKEPLIKSDLCVVRQAHHERNQ